MLDASLLSFVLESLPAPPSRVLEVGAGDGQLAAALISTGYDVVAIDPAAKGPDVRSVALHELEEAPASFDSALAVLSMHHVQPLIESSRRLGEVVRAGGVLVLDEIDFARFDERAAGWWLDHHVPGDDDSHGHDTSSPGALVADLRHHCHLLSEVEAALGEWFELGPAIRGPYLYRWDMSPELRETELGLITDGVLPATGARIVGRRR
jgi:SAM-dependent methyltransferase